MENENTMKDEKQITKQIEAVLFYSGEPVSFSFLAKILEIDKSEVKKEIENLSQILKDRGVSLVVHQDEVSLVTAPEMSDLIDKVIKDERETELGRASIETLTIVAYKGPISRKEIEYIRGVNCQFALRNLLLRGLIEKKNKDGDERSFMYNVTMDAVMHLGLKQISELPEYENMRKKLETTEEEIAESETENNG